VACWETSGVRDLDLAGDLMGEDPAMPLEGGSLAEFEPSTEREERSLRLAVAMRERRVSAELRPRDLLVERRLGIIYKQDVFIGIGYEYLQPRGFA